jgi:polyisoprenoid-binding protein YceI
MSLARSCAWLVLLIGSGSMAAQASPAVASLAIDPARSSARFVVHMRIRMKAEGQMKAAGGELRGSAAHGWRVLMKVDGRSLRFDGPIWMDRITRSDAFLAVARYPAIRFESEPFADAILHAGGALHGQLTLRGLTRPVSFQMLPSPCARIGRDCDIQVQGTISRHAFGMNAHRALVKDDVDFHMRVRLRADAASP